MLNESQQFSPEMRLDIFPRPEMTGPRPECQDLRAVMAILDDVATHGTQGSGLRPDARLQAETMSDFCPVPK